MSILSKNPSGIGEKEKFYQKKWFRALIVVVLILVVVASVFFWKAGSVLNKISEKGGLFKNIISMVPGVNQEVKGEAEGRINILLLAMRGENVPGGGLLADTIMVVSVKPAENKVSMISVPRDLYVDNPAWGNKTKINAVFAAGEENGKKQGIEDMKKVVGDVMGAPIHYAMTINFKGFTDLVDSIGGIDIVLDKPFEEAMQFNEEHECDANVFTKLSGNYMTKKKRTNAGRLYYARIPLCTNPDTECGGSFKLPAGANTLSGEQALCYARSRKTSSDFERAKRQQIVIQKIKEKALSAGTLTDFSKISGMLDSLGDNVKTDMQPWEMKRLYELYSGMKDYQLFQRVLENTEEGFLYNPENADPSVGYILLPRGDNYDKIHDMFQSIFSLPAQSDINPR